MASSTHLVVIRDCDVSRVWRDRNAIEEALRDVHVVLLFPEQALETKTRNYFLAESLGMTAVGSIYLCVDSLELYKRSEKVIFCNFVFCAHILRAAAALDAPTLYSRAILTYYGAHTRA